jgi:hypothetical protein
MKARRFAFSAVAAAFILGACAESPVAPANSALSAATITGVANSQGSARGAAKFSYTFTELRIDGATGTIASGINARGRVVGWYLQPGLTQGFIYEAGKYTTQIVYPDVQAGAHVIVTQLRGIGPGGEIVGTYRKMGEPVITAAHGFILTTSGKFIPVDYPDHINTIAQRILPNGTILGCYHDLDQMNSMHGMSINWRSSDRRNPDPRRRHGISAVSMAASMSNGGTPDGRRITGLFTDMTVNRGRAYVLEGGKFTPFDAPNSSSTAAWDMSPSGTIVGLFADAAKPQATHGFVLERGQFTTINFPNSTYTDVFGTNASGDLVGKYKVTADVSFHGYVATRRAEE